MEEEKNECGNLFRLLLTDDQSRAGQSNPAKWTPRNELLVSELVGLATKLLCVTKMAI